MRFIPGVAASRNGVVAAIASRDLARARDVAAAANVPRAHGSYEALLADPDIDAIYIGLPNALHAEWAIAAAEAGKPTLCEKPLARDAEEAQRVVDAFAHANVPLMEAFMYRFHPQHARVRELIAQGAIGDVRAVHAAFMFRMPSLQTNNIRLSKTLAGGALNDVGCYAVNAARMLFGEEPAWASGHADVREDLGVDVALSGVLGFSGNRMASIDCSFLAAGKGSYSVAGTQGRIDCIDAFTPATLEETMLVRVDVDGKQHIERIAGVDQYRLEAEAFADALLAKHDVPIAPSDAVANMRVLDALKRSAISHASSL